MQALKEGDAAQLASIHAPDARLMPPRAPAKTRPAIQEYWQGAMNMGVNGGALKAVSLEENGDTAIEVCEIEMRADAQLLDTGKYVAVHRRQPDGAWKLVIDIWNSDQTPTG